MNTTPFNKTALETLLTPENTAHILIDYQPFQFASVNSHDPHRALGYVATHRRASNSAPMIANIPRADANGMF